MTNDCDSKTRIHDLYCFTLPTYIPDLNIENLVVNQIYTLNDDTDNNSRGLRLWYNNLNQLAKEITPITTHVVVFKVPESATVTEWYYDVYVNQIKVTEIIPFTDIHLHVPDINSYFYNTICYTNKNNKHWLASTSIAPLRKSAFAIFEDMIQYVENPTDEDYLFAVNHCGFAVKHIPADKITFDLVKSALMKNIYILNDIPRPCRTPEMIRFAIENGKHFYISYIIMNLHEDEKTQDICNMAFEKDVYVFSYLPDSRVTPEMAQFAVTKDPMLLQFVPDRLQTKDMILGILRQMPEAIKFVYHQTQEMADMVAFRSSKAMQHVRKEFYTPAMCLHALQKYGWSFKFVKPRNQTHEVCVVGVTRFRKALRRVVNQTLEICLAAVTQDGMKLKYVRQQTPLICEMAVRQCREALRYVRLEFETPELIRFAKSQ